MDQGREADRSVLVPEVTPPAGLEVRARSILAFGLDEDLRILWASDLFLQAVGCGAEVSPLGKRLPEVIAGLREEHVALVKLGIEAEESFVLEEIAYQDPHGAITWWNAEIVALPASSPPGGTSSRIRVAVVLSNVSEQVRRREELERLQAEQARGKELAEAINSVALLINSSLRLDHILSEVAKRGGEALRSETTAIVVREEEEWALRFCEGERGDLEGSRFSPEELPLLTEMGKSGRAQVVPDTAKLSPAGIATASRFGSRALLASPLVVQGQLFGGLYFHYHSSPRDFSPAEIDFVERLANLVSLAAQNARVYELHQTIATELQKALTAVLPRVPGAAVARLYRSSTELARVGGDFFDVFEVNRCVLAIVIGDVCGHGVTAARLAATTRDFIRAYSYESPRPDSILERVNSALVRQGVTARNFVGVFLAVFHTSTGSLRYALAGHLPPLLIPASGEAVFLPTQSQAPLAAREDARYESQERMLSPGDRLLLYTDGVIEARREGQMFGERRLLALMRLRRHVPLEQLPRLVLKEVESFSSGRLRDDLALLALEYRQ